MAFVEGDGLESSKAIKVNHVKVTGLPNGAVQIILGRKAAEAVRTLLYYIGGDPAGIRGLVEKIAVGIDRLGGRSDSYLKESLISKRMYKQGYIGPYFKDKRRG